MAAPPPLQAADMRNLQKELRLCDREVRFLLQTTENWSRTNVKVVFQNVINSLQQFKNICLANLKSVLLGGGNLARAQALVGEIEILNDQMMLICYSADNFIKNTVLTNVDLPEDRLFYMILVGGLYKSQIRERSGIQTTVVPHYEMATEFAEAFLPGSNPIRLKLALKYAKLQHGSLDDTPRGLAICNMALEAAGADMGPDPSPLSMYYLGRIEECIHEWPNAQG